MLTDNKRPETETAQARQHRISLATRLQTEGSTLQQGAFLAGVYRLKEVVDRLESLASSRNISEWDVSKIWQLRGEAVTLIDAIRE